MKKLKIMLIEDELFTRKTIQAALEQNNFKIAFETDQVSAALEFAQNNTLDAVVVDYNLGSGPNGIDAANALRKLQPTIGVVLLSAFLNPRQLQSKMAKLPPGSRYLIKHAVTDISVLVNEINEVVAPAL